MWGAVEILTRISVVAGVLGVAAGAFMLLLPGTLREGGPWRRWLAETDLAALLDMRRTIERPLYRHHRAFGAAVVAGALAWFATLWGFRNRLPLPGEYASTVTLAICALAAFALGIGIFLVIRPSALKALETVANRWIEPFPLAGRTGAPPGYDFLNRIVVRAPRVSGLLLLAAGLGCFTLST